MKALYLILALGLAIAAPPVAAQEGASERSRAAQAYRDGDYRTAQRLYQNQLGTSAADPTSLLYNLGNCAYRLGNDAEALWNFRRARKRAPNDLAIRWNERCAEQRLGIADTTEDSLVASAWRALESTATASLLAWVGALQTIGLTVFLLLRRQRHPAKVTAVGVLAAGIALATYIAVTRLANDAPEGIILAPRASVRTAPHRTAPVATEISSGTSVQVEEWSDRWARVRHASGDGWVERNGLGIID